MYDEICEIVKTSKPDGIVTRLKRNSSLWLEITNKTTETASNAERIYMYVNNITSPVCCPCGEPVKFVSIVKGYNRFCCSKCSFAKQAQVEGRKKAMPDGIGLANKAIKEKAIQTLQSRRGVTNPGQLPEHRMAMTIDNPMFNSDVVAGIRDAAMASYGVDWHSKRSDIQEINRNTMRERYGVGNPAQIGVPIDQLTSLAHMKEMFSMYSIEQIADHLGVCETTVLRYLNRHGLRQPYTSTPELQITSLFQEMGYEVINRSRGIIPPLEIDIYIPQLALAVEYCGLYWHGELGANAQPRASHYTKYARCLEKGIRLVTIFEDEWINKRSVCEHRLRYFTGSAAKKIGARKLEIKRIESTSAFVDKYHIQGNAAATYHYGAFLHGTMVAAMTFGKRRVALGSKTHGGYELIRFCTDGGSYPGVASRMFHAFIREVDPIEVVSYCDLRWGTGGVYNALGFVRDCVTKPGYWYFGGDIGKYTRKHRWNYRKSVLVTDYGCSTDVSEWEWMSTHGYDRIWDCGHEKWVWYKT